MSFHHAYVSDLAAEPFIKAVFELVVKAGLEDTDSFVLCVTLETVKGITAENQYHVAVFHMLRHTFPKMIVTLVDTDGTQQAMRSIWVRKT